MNEIVSINMKWGDCHILHHIDNNIVVDTLMVDCGSKERINNNTNSINRCVTEFKRNYNNKINGLVTHYHTDHYSIFIELLAKNIVVFDTFYLPKMVPISQKNKLSLQTIAFFFTLFMRPTSIYFKASLSTVKLLNWISIRKCKIKFLEQNNSFHIGKDTYEVLWPNWNQINTQMQIYNKIYERIMNILPDEIKSILEDNFLEQYEDLLNGISNEFTERKVIEINNFINSFLDDNNNKEKNYELLSLLKNRQLYKFLSDDLNKTSTVFHLDCRLLMLADINQEIFDNYIVQYGISNFYQVTKAPHHGTDNYYSHLIPNSQHVIINNYLKKNYSKTSNAYYLSFPSKFRNIHCLNSVGHINCLANKTGLSCGTCTNSYAILNY